MKYRSQADLKFILTTLIFIALPILSSVLSIYYEIAILPFTVMFILIDLFIIVPMWMNTVYEFEEECLFISCGLFVKIRIKYSDIVRYGKSKGEFSYTALSGKGLKIRYKKGNQTEDIYISPQYIGFFLDEMRKNTGLDSDNFGKKI